MVSMILHTQDSEGDTDVKERLSDSDGRKGWDDLKENNTETYITVI